MHYAPAQHGGAPSPSARITLRLCPCQRSIAGPWLEAIGPVPPKLGNTLPPFLPLTRALCDLPRHRPHGVERAKLMGSASGVIEVESLAGNKLMPIQVQPDAELMTTSAFRSNILEQKHKLRLKSRHLGLPFVRVFFGIDSNDGIKDDTVGRNRSYLEGISLIDFV